MKMLYNQRDSAEWQQFIALIEQAVAEGRLDALLEMFLTADERNSLGLRVQIVNGLLNSNLTQREIQQQLNTSVATITRGSNMLKTVDPDIRDWVRNKLNG